MDLEKKIDIRQHSRSSERVGSPGRSTKQKTRLERGSGDGASRTISRILDEIVVGLTGEVGCRRVDEVD